MTYQFGFGVVLLCFFCFDFLCPSISASSRDIRGVKAFAAVQLELSAERAARQHEQAVVAEKDAFIVDLKESIEKLESSSGLSPHEVRAEIGKARSNADGTGAERS